MPDPPEEGLPHPKSVDVELIKQLIQKDPNMPLLEFLIENFDGVGETIAKTFLDFVGYRRTCPWASSLMTNW